MAAGVGRSVKEVWSAALAAATLLDLGYHDVTALAGGSTWVVASVEGLTDSTQVTVAQVVANTPVYEYGIPSIFPQIPNIPPYHNNGIWPFVQAYWTLAAAKTAPSATESKTEATAPASDDPMAALKAASVGRTSPGASLPETIRAPRSWATMLCRLRLA